MADAAADIHAAVARQVELAGCVAAVLHRTQRRGQERCFALSAVRVAGEDPAGVFVPTRAVGRVGVVCECDRGTGRIRRCKSFLDFKASGPEIVETDDLQGVDFGQLVAQDVHTMRLCHCSELVGELRIGPFMSVIVIAQDTEGCPRSLRQMRKHLA